MKKITIILLSFIYSCTDAQIDKKKLFFLLDNGSVEDAPFWLAGGVAESDTYTVYDFVNATDLATSFINLANPGIRNATAPVSEPSHAQGVGVTFSGSPQYLNTNTNLKAGSTVIVWVENSAGVYAVGAVQYSATRQFYIRPVNSSNTRLTYGATSSDAVNATIGGVLGLKSTNGFKQGMPVTTSGTWTGANHSIPVYIGCENQAGTPANYFIGRILRVAIYDITLTDSQIEAVSIAMTNYNQPSPNAYQATVLASNPIAYYPLTQAIGSACWDVSGNSAHGEVHTLTVGNDNGGGRGLSINGNGVAVNSFKAVPGFASRTGINLNSFSFAVWIKLTADASNQVRVVNIYSGSGTEYFAMEIRSGQNLDLYCRENGTNQNATNIITSGLNGNWVHVVGYNNLSTGKFGCYVNGVKYEFPKTLTGFIDRTPDDGYPYAWQDVFGGMNHLSFYNHALTQEEVDALLN